MMKRGWLFVALLAMPLAVYADGAELYGQYCSNCHGEKAEMLAGKTGSAERFRAILEGDTQDMPDFYGMFEPEEVDALYEYVTTVTAQEE